MQPDAKDYKDLLELIAHIADEALGASRNKSQQEGSWLLVNALLDIRARARAV